MSAKRDATAILEDAAATLQTAEWGLADLLGADPRRRLPGLRNVVVFGRAVTNVLQNLRSVVGEDFDAWYEPIQKNMQKDKLLRFFYKMRSEVLKTGSLGEMGHTHRIRLNYDDLKPLLQHPPPGAKGFFMGDSLGGSGWRVELPDGTEERYYVALPAEVSLTTEFTFANPPRHHQRKRLDDTSAQALATHYVAFVRRLVREATERFGA